VAFPPIFLISTSYGSEGNQSWAPNPGWSHTGMLCRPSFRKLPRGGGGRPMSVCVSIRSLGGWRHAPPGNFGILDSLRLLLVHSQALIWYYLNACKYTTSSGVRGMLPLEKVLHFRLSEIASDAFSRTNLVLFECSLSLLYYYSCYGDFLALCIMIIPVSQGGQRPPCPPPK
jgi:hypothetical protein